jgi:opacity protein-like surface antigen
MKPSIITTALALVSLPAFAGSSAPITEQPITQPAEVSPWEFRMALYGWAEGLNGDIGFLGRTASVDVSFGDIVKELDMGFMGAFELRRGRWSLVADLVYADIGAKDKIGDISIDFKEQQILGNFTINYEVMKNHSMMFYLYAGARVNWMDLTLELDDSRTPFRDFRESVSQSWVDPIVGARFAANLSEKFFFYTSGDIGGFGVSSQLTWQAMAGFGYRVTENGSLLFGYRAIGTDYTNGGFTYDLVASGPVIGFEYKF